MQLSLCIALDVFWKRYECIIQALEPDIAVTALSVAVEAIVLGAKSVDATSVIEEPKR